MAEWLPLKTAISLHRRGRKHLKPYEAFRDFYNYKAHFAFTRSSIFCHCRYGAVWMRWLIWSSIFGNSMCAVPINFRDIEIREFMLHCAYDKNRGKICGCQIYNCSRVQWIKLDKLWKWFENRIKQMHTHVLSRTHTHMISCSHFT